MNKQYNNYRTLCIAACLLASNVCIGRSLLEKKRAARQQTQSVLTQKTTSSKDITHTLHAKRSLPAHNANTHKISGGQVTQQEELSQSVSTAKHSTDTTLSLRTKNQKQTVAQPIGASKSSSYSQKKSQSLLKKTDSFGTSVDTQQKVAPPKKKGLARLFNFGRKNKKKQKNKKLETTVATQNNLQTAAGKIDLDHWVTHRFALAKPLNEGSP